MNDLLIRNMIAGAVVGLFGAIVADLDAWKSGEDPAPFDWRKAVRRYVYGALVGASSVGGLTVGMNAI